MNDISRHNFQLVTEINSEESEFVPLLSHEDEELMEAEKIPEIIPVLPLRNTVLFPGVVIPITVGRDKSIQLVKESYRNNRIIGVVAQKDPNQEDPGFEDLYQIGTIASLMKILQMPDGSTTIIIQGKKRFQIEQLVTDNPYFKARVNPFKIDRQPKRDKKFNALISSVKDTAIQIIKLSPNIPSDAVFAIQNIESPFFLINFVASNLNIDLAEKQKLLEINDPTERANQVLAGLIKELQMLELKNQIQDKVKHDLDKQQRDYILHQQLKTIQEELGGANAFQQAVDELKTKAEAKKWSKEVKEVFDREFNKIIRMNPAAMEYSMQLNYLETFVELPWNEYSPDNFDLRKAQKVLDEDHYGLEKVKDRIIEYLAVLKLKGDMKSPILCFAGPPGVGKTSLGKSIARALGRNYIRMSLGGLRDEAEIRGHRRTYIGALPGRIINNLKKAKSANPVFVLDEVDKILGMNINGDPAAALLEVLDPEQNTNFHDNYLEVDFDLSRVMFIATANTLSTIHPALRDRMEIIDLPGYLIEEKIQIAQNHLIPKQLKEHGLKKTDLKFSDAVLEKVIEDYTRESGVRSLEKNIAKIIRSKAKHIAFGETYNKKMSVQELGKILGIARYQRDRDLKTDQPGIAVGLAWTAEGGEILFIEASLSKGKGNLTLTGNLGDVMKESATLAYQYLKSNASSLSLDTTVFGNWDLHIHVPEGATPKDGPSAGITIFTALASVFSQRKVKTGLAMTGEVTLRGKVLPVGGIKEKILAAKRAKIKDIILSAENKKDILEIKPDYIEGLTFHYIHEMKEAIPVALEKNGIANPINFTA